MNAYIDALGGLGRVLDGLQIVLPGAPLPVVQLTLFDAIDEFCSRSCIWRETVAWSMAVGVSAVDLNPVNDVALAVWVWRISGLRARVQAPAILIDTDVPRTARAGTALVVCKPNRLAEFALPSFLVDNWSEALRDGALSRLFSQPNKPWTDPRLAIYHGQRFRQQMSLAKESARRNGDLPPPSFPYFARGQQRAFGSETRFGYIGNGTPVVPGEVIDPDTPPVVAIPSSGDQDGGIF